MGIFDNLLYKLVALLIAGLLWAAAQGVGDLKDSVDLRVSYRNVPEELVVVDQSAQEINVQLIGSRSGLRQARQALTDYTVSLEGVKEGEARFAVVSENLQQRISRSAKVTARSPSQISFRTERVASKRVPVRAALEGELPTGYRVTEVRVEPAQIVIEGARTGVRRIREVSTQRIDLSRLRASSTLETPIFWDVPNVWRKDGRGDPVQVTVVIESPAGPEPDAAVQEG